MLVRVSVFAQLKAKQFKVLSKLNGHDTLYSKPKISEKSAKISITHLVVLEYIYVLLRICFCKSKVKIK